MLGARTTLARTITGPAVLAVVLTGLAVIAPSNVNRSAWAWQFALSAKRENVQSMLLIRDELGAFASRPLMTAVIRCIDAVVGDVWVAYVGAILVSYFVAALSLQHAARRLDGTGSGRALIVFGASFSVLFAFFAPVYGYDDLIQYAFVFLALAWVDAQPLRCGLLLCLAVIARETTVLVLPGLTWVVYAAHGNTIRQKHMRWVKAVVLPAAFYVLYTRLLPFPEMPDRFQHWRFNFENMNRTVESLLSPIMALSVVLVLASVVLRMEPSRLGNQKRWLIAFLVVFAVNTPIVFIATKARENRLFALPLIFLWPIAGSWLRDSLSAWHGARRISGWWTRVALPSMIPAVAVLAAVFSFYHQTVARSFYDAFRIHLILVTYVAFTLHLSLSLIHRDTRRAEAEPLAGES